MTREKEWGEVWLDTIDSYNDTIYCMICFANLYWYDDKTKSGKPDVLVLQGRRFDGRRQGEQECGGETTCQPDLAILVNREQALVAEVKRTLPRDQTHWKAVFEQMQRYDQALKGWPPEDRELDCHDIALLVHQSRRRELCRYYSDLGVSFQRPFAIVEFNRSPERKPFFFFGLCEGGLSDALVHGKLKAGVPVPMAPLLDEYSVIKFYDGDPPAPHLLHVIWQEVIAPRALPEGGPRLQRGRKREVTVSVEELVTELRDRFGFKAIYGFDDDRQPKSPCRESVLRACERLVACEFARWKDAEQKDSLVVNFRVLDDILTFFIALCKAPPGYESAPSLFPEPELE